MHAQKVLQSLDVWGRQTLSGIFRHVVIELKHFKEPWMLHIHTYY